jgi:hypothetical protein
VGAGPARLAAQPAATPTTCGFAAREGAAVGFSQAHNAAPANRALHRSALGLHRTRFAGAAKSAATSRLVPLLPGRRPNHRWSRLAPAWHLARFPEWSIIRPSGQAPHRRSRLSSNVRFLQETHAQCDLAVMCKAMHAAEEVQSHVLRCCAAAQSKVNWFVGADHSVGKGCRAYRGLSVLRRPAHGFFAHRPLRARSLSRGACALGVGCTSRASAACEPRVAASREAVAYCGMRRAALLQHSGLAEVAREVQA